VFSQSKTSSKWPSERSEQSNYITLGKISEQVQLNEALKKYSEGTGLERIEHQRREQNSIKN